MTSGNLNPIWWIGIAQNLTVSINRYVQWMSYCQFGLLFTRLDNTIESTSGLTNAIFKYSLNTKVINTLAQTVQAAYDNNQCASMMIAVGQIFSLIFEFTVPEDTI